MSKRKLPGGCTNPATTVVPDPTSADSDAAAPLCAGEDAGAAVAKRICDSVKDASESPPSPFAIRPPINAKSTAQAEDPSLTSALAQMEESPPPVNRRIAPPGSPAAAFLLAAPNSPDQTLELNCNLTAVPREQWNKRRTLSAIIIVVLPIKHKGTTIRRNVVLRDQHGECIACVWGNHTQMVNESTVGKPITFQRCILQEFDGVIQVSVPKDGSLTMGPTPKTAPITNWVHAKGNQLVPIEEAVEKQHPDIFAIQGIVAQVVSEQITTKDGKMLSLTTVSIANGPPEVIMRVSFWHAKPEIVSTWNDLQHQAVRVTMIRCHIDEQRGNTYESIGTLTKIIKQKDPILEDWWFKPKQPE